MSGRAEGAVRLHHLAGSRSMRVLWLLHELGVPVEVVPRVLDRSLRGPEYRALHPVGRVPALEIDGTAIWESGAAIEYLCERHPEAGLGRAPGTPERAAWLTWLHFAETISQHGAALTQSHVALREPWMRSLTVMTLETKRLTHCLGVIEARLAGRAWLLDGGFSAVDVAVGQAVWMSRHFVPLDPDTALSGWVARFSDRPAFRAALPAEGEPRLYARDFYPLPEAPPAD